VPIETYIACAAVLVVFGAFMAPLAWVLWYTKDVTERW
jgi:hypothetical protein